MLLQPDRHPTLNNTAKFGDKMILFSKVYQINHFKNTIKELAFCLFPTLFIFLYFLLFIALQVAKYVSVICFSTTSDGKVLNETHDRGNKGKLQSSPFASK